MAHDYQVDTAAGVGHLHTRHLADRPDIAYVSKSLRTSRSHSSRRTRSASRAVPSAPRACGRSIHRLRRNPDGSRFLKTCARASSTSHSIGAPAASRMRCTAVTHSGPIPSPGMNVAGIVLRVRLLAHGQTSLASAAMLHRSARPGRPDTMSASMKRLPSRMLMLGAVSCALWRRRSSPNLPRHRGPTGAPRSVAGSIRDSASSTSTISSSSCRDPLLRSLLRTFPGPTESRTARASPIRRSNGASIRITTRTSSTVRSAQRASSGTTIDKEKMDGAVVALRRSATHVASTRRGQGR